MLRTPARLFLPLFFLGCSTAGLDDTSIANDGDRNDDLRDVNFVVEPGPVFALGDGPFTVEVILEQETQDDVPILVIKTPIIELDPQQTWDLQADHDSFLGAKGGFILEYRRAGDTDWTRIELHPHEPELVFSELSAYPSTEEDGRVHFAAASIQLEDALFGLSYDERSLPTRFPGDGYVAMRALPIPLWTRGDWQGETYDLEFEYSAR